MRGASGTNSNTSIKFTQPLGDGYVGLDSNGAFSYGISANLITSKFKVDRSGNATFAGNVGIGTTSPSYKLTSYSTTAEGDGTDEFPIVAGKANAIGNFTGIGLASYIATNGAVKAGIALERVGSYGTGKLHFLNNDTINNLDATLSDSKMTIWGGGVGIGTTSPNEKLSIDTGSNGSAGYISVDSQTLTRLKLGYSFTSSPSAITAAQIYADSSGNLDISSRGNAASAIQLYTSSGTSPSERMRIASDGKVGIGTTAYSQCRVRIASSVNIY